MELLRSRVPTILRIHRSGYFLKSGSPSLPVDFQRYKENARFGTSKTMVGLDLRRYRSTLIESSEAYLTRVLGLFMAR